MKNIILILVIILMTSCSQKYYATEWYKVKSSKKELKIKKPKQKHITKAMNWYM